MEPAPAHAVGVGGGVAPVSGEHAGAIGDHLAHGLVGVEQATVRGEAGARALGAGVRVDDQHAGGARTQGGVGGVGRAGDGDAALAGAEAVDHGHAEATRELVPHLGWGLVAVDHAHGVVVVVLGFGRGEDVGQGRADVVGEGAAIAADVGEPSGGRESAADDDRAAGEQGDGPGHHDGVGVEQRHGAVDAVVRADAEAVGEHAAGHGDLGLRDPHGLGVAAGAGGEHERDQIVGPHGHIGEVGQGRAGVPGEQGCPVGGVDGHHGGGQVEALEQGLVLAVREDQSAVGEGGIARQGLAAPRGIESGDDDLGARRRGQQV